MLACMIVFVALSRVYSDSEWVWSRPRRSKRVYWYSPVVSRLSLRDRATTLTAYVSQRSFNISLLLQRIAAANRCR
jgi:hypothetical protein